MRARAFKTHKHFEGIFDVGDVVEMIKVPYDKDTLLVWGQAVFTINGERVTGRYINTKDISHLTHKDVHQDRLYNYSTKEIESGKWSILNEPVIAPKGSQKELHFQLPDGRIYNTDIVYRSLGKHFPDFFEKLAD